MNAHVITDVATRGEGAFVALLDAVAPARPAFFQVRERTVSDRELLRFVTAARQALSAATRVLVSGRPDVAVAGGADGVQLPSKGIPAKDVRRFFPAPFVIGVSCHSWDDVRRAADDGADFALLAPIYAPTSKPFDRPPLGPETLDGTPSLLPLHVLGGLTVERVASWPLARRNAVSAVAGIGAFRSDPGGAVEALRLL